MRYSRGRKHIGDEQEEQPELKPGGEERGEETDDQRTEITSMENEKKEKTTNENKYTPTKSDGALDKTTDERGDKEDLTRDEIMECSDQEAGTQRGEVSDTAKTDELQDPTEGKKRKKPGMIPNIRKLIEKQEERRTVMTKLKM